MKKDWVHDHNIYTNIFDIIPINDLAEHINGDDCFCRPKIEYNIIIHNSLDGREEYEKLFGTTCSVH